MSEQIKIRNAADPEKIKEGKKSEDMKRKQEIKDVFDVISTEPGKRFYMRMLAICKVYHEVAEASGSFTYYNAGKRAVGLTLQSDLVRASPEIYASMVREAYDAEKEF